MMRTSIRSQRGCTVGPLRGETPVVSFSGSLGTADALWLEDQVDRARGASPSVVVDASGIVRLDSSILVTLLRLNRECRRRNGRLVLADPSPSIARILTVTGIENVLAVEHFAVTA